MIITRASFSSAILDMSSKILPSITLASTVPSPTSRSKFPIICSSFSRAALDFDLLLTIWSNIIDVLRGFAKNNAYFKAASPTLVKSWGTINKLALISDKVFVNQIYKYSKLYAQSKSVFSSIQLYNAKVNLEVDFFYVNEDVFCSFS